MRGRLRGTDTAVDMRTKQRRRVCVLLTDRKHLDSTVRVGARGRELLNVVLEQLGVTDLHVLGLAVLRDNEYLFLDLEQKLGKYFGKKWSRSSTTVPFVFFLRVQFYEKSLWLIMSRKEQQLFFCQLRQKVLLSQSRHQEVVFFQLAASALQADVGDLSSAEVKHRNYFLPEDYFPSWLIKRRGREYLLQHTPVLHGELRGASRSQAVLRFIREVSDLQDAAVTFYRMRQKRELRCSILLGVAMRGAQIYQEVEGKLCLLYNLSWTDVDRFTFQGSRFEVHAVGSLCLPKLFYYTRSTFHSKHVLKHLSDSHRLHLSTREAAGYLQQLEDTRASCFYNESYICDTTRLRTSLHCTLTSSMSDSSVRQEEEEEEEEEEGHRHMIELEQSVDEPEEVCVDNPTEMSWLVELLCDTHQPFVLSPSCWAAVTMEMKQVLNSRAHQEVPVD